MPLTRLIDRLTAYSLEYVSFRLECFGIYSHSATAGPDAPEGLLT